MHKEIAAFPRVLYGIVGLSLTSLADNTFIPAFSSRSASRAPSHVVHIMSGASVSSRPTKNRVFFMSGFHPFTY
jgi:hypothetical protein